MLFSRHACYFYCIILLVLLSIANAQDTVLTPPIGDRSKERRVEASSTCGLTGPETYCEFLGLSNPPSNSLAPNCVIQTCDNTCPHGVTSPVLILLDEGPGLSSITTDAPATGQLGGSLKFSGLANSFVSHNNLPNVDNSLGFSFTTWIKVESGNNNGVIVSRSSGTVDIEELFHLRVSGNSLHFSYLPLTSVTASEFSIPSVNIISNLWYHIGVSIYQQDFAIYVNGVIQHATSLIANIKGPAGVLYLGRDVNGTNSFTGSLDIPAYYSEALTEREAYSAYSGSLSFLHLSPDCRCPPSHPVISSTAPSTCTVHPGITTIGDIGRLNSNAHPPSYSNDNLTNSYWLSDPAEKMVNITYILGDNLIEILYLLAVFDSPRPQSLVILKSSDQGTTFIPIQYYSSDCLGDFGMVTDAEILSPSDAICTDQFSIQSPVSNGLIGLDLFDPSRSGASSFNTNLEFRDFVSVNQIRLSFRNYFNSSTTDQHLYYSLSTLTVAARCKCNGHTDSCIYISTSSSCQCLHNTQGDQCEVCQPLFNDKPWLFGIPCVACTCNNHASLCTYDPSLDTNPSDSSASGGGVCVACDDNTQGRYCDECIDTFYRDVSKQIGDTTACLPCNCVSSGVTDQGLCSLGSNNNPQCNCKSNVEGPRCSTCKTGFFSLSASDPNGCTDCVCVTDGTELGSTACDAVSGQCACKSNVQGLKCDACKSGFTSLTSTNPDGCVSCGCNLIGSINDNCNPITSNCQCKPGVGATRCDTCISGFHSFSSAGCQACKCDLIGSVNNTICDAITGNCSCKSNVEGSNCDTCKDGFFDLKAFHTDGCISCECNLPGTSFDSRSCNTSTGSCSCKINVQGDECDECNPGFFNLQSSNLDGCDSCQCNILGTDTTGDICNQESGECICISPATGLRCDSCSSGHFLSPDASTLCEACSCNSQTSIDLNCNATTGQCDCLELDGNGDQLGFGGRTCEKCIEGFFQFSTAGCTSCNCTAAGSEGIGCDQSSGDCVCKKNVEGVKCDTCKAGFGFLNANDPFGCSSVPTGLSAPTLSILTSTSITTIWQPPSSQSAIQFYQVTRNSTIIHQTSALQFTDTSLSPYTVFTYTIIATNNAGSTESLGTSGRTLESIPTGVTPIIFNSKQARSLRISWIAPTLPNGIINLYQVFITSVSGVELGEVVNVFSGLAFSAFISDLQPFTEYGYILSVCNNAGCTNSTETKVTTLQAAPEQVSPPATSTITSDSILLTWIIPAQANGIITGYSVHQRESPFTGQGVSIGDVPSSVLSFSVSGLDAFTQYEFTVSATTSAGTTVSSFVRITTLEAVPAGVIVPTLTVQGPTSIQITWQVPSTPNAASISYNIIRTAPVPELVIISSTNVGSFQLFNLQPFTTYSFILQVCNVAGCSNSTVVTMTTDEQSPSGQPSPNIISSSANNISLEWNAPSQPNGIITSYTLSRRLPSLILASLPIHENGIRFHGAGYARFPANSFIAGFSTTISFRVRTFGSTGLLMLFTTSSMSDYIAISFNESALQFAFDSGTNSPTNIITLNVVISDGAWHTVTASRVGNEGSLMVNGSLSIDNSVVGIDNEIASSALALVGGIDSDTVLGNEFPVLSVSSFAGCLRDLEFNSDIVDFDDVVSSRQVELSLKGCPSQIEKGAHYPGAGFAKFEASSINLIGDTFEISFELKTLESTSTVLIIGENLMSASSDYLLLSISSSIPTIDFQINGDKNTLQSFTEAIIDVCDGSWHTIYLRKVSTEFSFTVDGNAQTQTFQGSELLKLDSMFLGGIDVLSPFYHKLKAVSLLAPNFGGCIRSLQVNEVELDYSFASDILNVDIDGCPTVPSGACTSASINDIMSGNILKFNDVGLKTFSEYYYRVTSQNSVGSTVSNWQRANTQQGVPTAPSSLQLSALSSSSIQASWTAPGVANGVLDLYHITTQLNGNTVSNISVSDIQSQLTIQGLSPFTTYSVSVSAQLTTGTVSAIISDTATTLQDVPAEVTLPTVDSIRSRDVTLTWQAPIQPNGIIISYSLIAISPNQSIVYTGDSSTLSTTVLSLSPFTEYQVLLRVCTVIGCTDSLAVSFKTSEDIPEDMSPPSLIVLDSRRILVQWTTPAIPNGVITNYTVLYAVSTDPSNTLTSINVTAAIQELTVSGLQPATEYQFSVRATNNIGSITSNVATNSTLHDVPEGISPPSVSVVTALSLIVVWQPPDTPNGDVINYKLLIDQSEIFSGLQLETTVTGLQPFTKYNLRLQACTVIGCGTSDSTQTSTLEATPVGLVLPSLTTRTSTTLTIQIQPVAAPNGLVTYTLYAMGVFNDSNGEVIRIVYSSVDTGQVVAQALLPFNSYTVYLDVNNTAGGIRSEVLFLQTLGIAPQGLSAPTLINSTSTSLSVSWSAASIPNGDIHSYLLYRDSNGITTSPVIIQATEDLIATLTSLRPATVYDVYVVAVNQFGNGTSDFSSLSTLESVPEDQPAPTTSQLFSRSVLLTWVAPSTPNGHLVQFNIIQTGIELTNTSSDTFIHTIIGLTPFTLYRYAIEACTAVGCFRSDEVSITTPEDAPEDLSEPRLESNSPTTVIIRWDPPALPNGLIQSYSLERSLPPNNTVTQIVTLNANATLVYIDNDESVLKPYLLVSYRVVATNRAGSSASLFANLRTLQAPPSALLPPTLSLPQPTAIQVRWLPPNTPNGLITEYILKYYPTNQPNLVQSVSLTPNIIEFTLHGLLAYENYSVSITGCTVGGCTESEVVVTETGQVLPTGFSVISVEVLSANGLLVTWLEPVMPNGLVTEYMLYRREEGVSYVEITRGLFLSFNDSSLLPFHEYQYSLDVTNGAGTTTYGNTSLIQTLPDSPLAGATLNASTTTSSIILLQWDTPAVDVLRGEIVNFEVVGYQAGSEQDVTSLFNGTDTMFSVTGLNPSINYVFKVILYNGVGYAESNTAEAKTLDGAPKGVHAPMLTVINSTTIQVEWLDPVEPNGVIVSYNVLQDGVSVHTDSMTGVILLTQLMPFTSYTFQLVACTRFQCTQSNTSSVITLQAPPTGLNAPTISDVQHNSFIATWAAPAISNGIITSYTLYLRYIIPCSQSTDQDTCDYLECSLGESRCGSQCYTTSTHVCCDNTLHIKAVNHACCAGNYIERASPSGVCCGGSFYTLQSQFSCCGGVYQAVAPGSICCTDGDTAIVGAGDTCCRTSAFTDSDSLMCCGSSVVSQHINTMCCGGMVVSAVDRVCCNGVVHDVIPGYVCCDTSYEADNTTLCCTARNGVERTISYTSPEDKSTADEKCCDVTPIPSQLSCCNNRAYNPQLETCADKSTSEGSNCGTGVTCTNSQASTAYCNRCDFPFSTYTCDTIDLTSSETQTCYETTPVFTGFAFSYNVTNLTPFTPYLVYAGVSNSAGETISSESSTHTLESAPNQVDTPTVTVLAFDMIQIEWTFPAQPNGIIIHFRLNRDSQEIAIVNDSIKYTDNNLLPFTSYSYTLSACTSVGCTVSTAVSGRTFESIPIGLAQPIATQLQATSIELTWSLPASPNGIIQNYTIYDSQSNIVFSGTSLKTTITGLSAFTQYTYTLQACNSIGCVLSQQTTLTTLEVSPTDIDPPITTIVRFDVLEIRWSLPNMPNGVLQYYLLRKDEVIILNTTNLTYTDTDVFASTMYRYTVEAFNNVGSIVSGAATVSTPDSTPSGLDPPVLTAVNATAVLIEWIPPTLPNGDIIQYDLYQDNVNFITITDTTLRSYTRTGLTPYTQYTFRVAACTRSGCAISNTVQLTTLEAPPNGLSPPFLLALTSSSLRVSWLPPSVLNGILTGYEVLQTTINQPPVQIPVPSNLNTIDINNLNAFTLYTYSVKARNSAGSITSADSSVRTLEDVPMLFNAATITDVSSRSLAINWQEPTKPNGIIILYYIYARIITTPLNPIPINREPVLLLTVDGNLTSTTIQDLEPGSSYEFRMVATNSIGEVITTWVPATTNEDSPELLQPIMYTADPSGTSLFLFWNEPLKPNGVINMYLIYLGSNAIFRGVSNSFTYRLLTPFTAYNLYLQACTIAGCTSGELQVITTAEIAPENQNIPLLETLGPSSIRITWQPPLNPNGFIIRYRLQRENPDGSISQIHTVLNTTLRTFIDTGLQSYSIYKYAVTAENSVGFTQSDFVSQRTDEGVPEVFDAPNVQPILSTEMLILWSSPSFPNGVITSYDVLRDGNTIISLSSVFVYHDRNLDPYTYYSYQISACNSRGGCVTSLATVERTLESIPQGVIAPSLTAISFSQVEIRWDPPTQPNGIIQQYMLAVNDVNQTVIITPFIYTQSNLLPYTIYRIAIIACTAVGCSIGSTSNILTLEYIPSGQLAPLVSVTSSKSTSVSWDVPTMPNGIIIGYDVIRNGNIVLFTNNTQDRIFTDTNLRPAMSYTYSIRAYTSIGASDASQGTVTMTSPDAPELLAPPTLTPLTSTSFKAEWSAPQIPNGMITRYDLIIDNKVNFTGLQFEYTVSLLTPFTQYSVVIRACTTTCTDSQIVTVVTNPDTPVGQAVPTLSAFEGPSVLIQWEPPDNPNGIITEYIIFRRELFTVNGQTTFSDEIIVTTVYNQLFTFDNATELKLYTNYQYKVVSVNSVGQAISEWVNVLTVQGIPQNVVPPELLSSIHTSIVLKIVPPQTPNGIITSYIVYRDGVQVAELTGSDNTTTVSNLLPYTLYQISITACTAAGCNTSVATALRTGEYTPEGLSTPVAGLIEARQIAFTWGIPTKPNGVIISYSIQAQLVCPQPTQPHILPGSCQYGSLATVYTGTGDQLNGIALGLTPYATYQFFLIATNSHSAKQSSPSIFYTTRSSVPEDKNTLVIRRLCNTVTVDWSDAFHLNGLLKNFVFLVNNNLMDSTISVTKTVGDLIYGTPYEFKVRAVTSIGIAEQANFVLIESAPHCSDPSPTTLVPTSNVTDASTTPVTIGSLGGIVLIVLAIIFILVLFLCFFAFFGVILFSRKERDKYRTMSRTPLLAATSSKMDDPLSDLTLQESLMLENRSNTLDLSLPRSKHTGSIANSSISYGNSIRTPPSARYSPRLRQLDPSMLKQSSDIDFSQDESGFRDTRL